MFRCTFEHGFHLRRHKVYLSINSITNGWNISDEHRQVIHTRKQGYGRANANTYIFVTFWSFIFVYQKVIVL